MQEGVVSWLLECWGEKTGGRREGEERGEIGEDKRGEPLYKLAVVYSLTE